MGKVNIFNVPFLTQVSLAKKFVDFTNGLAIDILICYIKNDISRFVGGNYEQYRKSNSGNYVDCCITIMVFI